MTKSAVEDAPTWFSILLKLPTRWRTWSHHDSPSLKSEFVLFVCNTLRCSTTATLPHPFIGLSSGQPGY